MLRPPGAIPGWRTLTMQKTYHGSCHCGAVRFECELDFAKGTSKCNCSACGKYRFWKAIVMAPSFRLLQGQDALADYQFGSHTIHHRFCKHCGTKPFGHARSEERRVGKECRSRRSS